MNKDILKIVRDKMPESLKYNTASFFRNTLIKNSDFLKYYKLLEKEKSQTPKELKNIN